MPQEYKAVENVSRVNLLKVGICLNKFSERANMNCNTFTRFRYISFFGVVGLFAVAFAVTVPTVAHADEKFPAVWRKTMTNDPATNYALKKYSGSLGNPSADVLRNVMLSLALAHFCQGSLVNQRAASSYLKNSGYYSLSGKAWDDASFLAQDQFRDFDYRSIAHLCAGIGYLFGEKGVLIGNVLSPGSGEPNGAYDAANPYASVPPLRKPAG